jgi:hypothetical protein
MWLDIMISIYLGPTFSNLRMTHSTISGISSVYRNWHVLSLTVDGGSCICLLAHIQLTLPIDACLHSLGLPMLMILY